MTKFKTFLLFSLLILSLLPAGVVLADTGPKPTMEFTFQQELAGEPLTITSGIMYECEQSDCSDAAPLEELGPQRFTCEADSCYALAYGLAPYHKIEIEFSDGKTRESNIFQTAGFDSKYTVTVRSDDLLVESQFNPAGLFPGTGLFVLLCACACAFLIGALVIGLIIYFVRRRSKS